MKDCKKHPEYLETYVLMECAICHKKENSKPRSVAAGTVCPFTSYDR